MRRDKRNDGWDEVTIVKIMLTGIYKAFQTCGYWVEYIQRHPQMNSKGRNHCERCGDIWAKLHPDTMTYFVMTDKGNKVVCAYCFNEMKPHLDYLQDKIKIL